jgi:hypothetical protein
VKSSEIVKHAHSGFYDVGGRYGCWDETRLRRLDLGFVVDLSRALLGLFVDLFVGPFVGFYIGSTHRKRDVAVRV